MTDIRGTQLRIQDSDLNRTGALDDFLREAAPKPALGKDWTYLEKCPIVEYKYDDQRGFQAGHSYEFEWIPCDEPPHLVFKDSLGKLVEIDGSGSIWDKIEFSGLTLSGDVDVLRGHKVLAINEGPKVICHPVVIARDLSIGGLVPGLPFADLLSATIQKTSANLRHELLKRLVKRPLLSPDGLDWIELQHSVLARLPDDLQDLVRVCLVNEYCQSDSGCTEAWRLPRNRPLVERKSPRFARGQRRAFAVQHVLQKLGAVAIDTETRGQRLSELGLVYASGKEIDAKTETSIADAIRGVVEDRAASVLVGHNVSWDVAYLAEKLNQPSLADIRIIDTLVLDCILEPRGANSLALNGEHHALPDAKLTLEKLLDQIEALACLPQKILENWMSIAGPGLADLFALVIKHQVKLRSSNPTSLSSPAASLASQNDQTLAGQVRAAIVKYGAQKCVWIVPLELTGLLSPLEDSVVLDPAGQYIASAINTSEPQGRRFETSILADIDVCLDSIRQTLSDPAQPLHVGQLRDWLRYRIDELDAKSILSSYESTKKELLGRDARHIVMTYAGWQTDLTLRQLSLDASIQHVILVAPELGYLDLKLKHTVTAVPWAMRRECIRMGGCVSLTSEDAEALGICTEAGRRFWLVDRAAGEPRVYSIPLDAANYVERQLPGRSLHVVNLESGPSPIFDALVAKKPRGTDTYVPVSSNTRYRAEYLAHIASLVIPMTSDKSVLLAFRDEEEARAFGSAAKARFGVYCPTGSRLTRMLRLSGNPGLAVTTIEQVPNWALIAQDNVVMVPFGEVIMECRPSDVPEWVPPPAYVALNEFPLIARPDVPVGPDEDEPNDERELTTERSAIVAGSVVEAPSDLWRSVGAWSWAAKTLCGASGIRFLESHPDSVASRPLLTVRNVPATAFQNSAERLAFIASMDVDYGMRRERQSPTLTPLEWQTAALDLFGVESLHPWQLDWILRIAASSGGAMALRGATGSGKSLVFQLPSIVRALQNGLLSVVISPLKALMQEQVYKLHNRGFGGIAEALTGDLQEIEVSDIYSRIASGDVLLAYVAPERFRSKRFQNALATRIARDGRVQHWIFDEAHCISQWGHEFRPDYLNALQRILEYRDLSRHETAGAAPMLFVSATISQQALNDLTKAGPNGH